MVVQRRVPETVYVFRDGPFENGHMKYGMCGVGGVCVPCDHIVQKNLNISLHNLFPPYAPTHSTSETHTQGAVEYYNKILVLVPKISYRSKYRNHTKHQLSSTRTRQHSRRSRSSVYRGCIPVKRCIDNLFKNMTMLQCMTLPYRERVCLDSLRATLN